MKLLLALLYPVALVLFVIVILFKPEGLLGKAEDRRV